MRCCQCGKKATKKEPDPYFEELPELRDDPDEKLEEEWWCDECYQERLWDI
jgi:hypothetical protein